MTSRSASFKPTKPPPLPIELSDADIEEVISGIEPEVNTDLRHIFELQVKLMRHFKAAGTAVPDWPVDISQKQNQRICRDTGLKAIEEFFEAIQHMKNWKPHRKTEVPEFDREAFLEEIVDSLHYTLELLCFLGVTPEELVLAYECKNAIVHKRIDEGY